MTDEPDDDDETCPTRGQRLPPADDDDGMPAAAAAPRSYPEWERLGRMTPAARQREQLAFNARIRARYPIPGTSQPAEARSVNYGWDEIADKINGASK